MIQARIYFPHRPTKCEEAKFLGMCWPVCHAALHVQRMSRSGCALRIAVINACSILHTVEQWSPTPLSIGADILLNAQSPTVYGSMSLCFQGP